MRILNQGGNAFDATVAVVSTLNMVEPMFSGIGGAGFAVVYLADKKEIKVLNFTGKSPYAAKIDMYKELKKDLYGMSGPLSSPVPGNFGGWCELLKLYGTMSLGQVFQTAIQYAEEGIPIPDCPNMNSLFEETSALLTVYPTTAKIFVPGGRILKKGDIYYNKDLAKTMRKLVAAEKGARHLGRKKAIEAAYNVFYTGEIAKAFLKFYKENGGIFTEKDFADFKPEWVEPISSTYRGYKIYGAPPNSSALMIHQELNIMEGFDVKTLGLNTPEYIHNLAEAIKIARAHRPKYLADPKFARIPVQELLSKGYAETLRAKIDPNKAAESYELPEKFSSTTHICIADRHGNMVSLTNTLGGFFGSKLVVGNTGVLFSNGMNWLDIDPNSVNRVEGGKRPRWNMCPSMVFKDDKPFMAIGTPAGEAIWQTIPQVIMNVIDFGMNIQDAIEAPRIHGSEKNLHCEARIPVEVQNALKAKGHKIIPMLPPDWNLRFGSVSGIIVHPNRIYLGGADPRLDTYAIGW
jgi:gamma-glutamyltranspeptidase / glutathione hydrolase